MRQEGSHAQSLGPDTVPREGGKERQLCSSGPAEPSVPLFLYNSAKPLADTIFVAHRNGAGPHLGRNTAAEIASMCLALAQECSQAGGVLPCTAALCLPFRQGRGLGVQRIGWGQIELSENWSFCTCHRPYLSALLQHLRSWLTLKPRLGGSSDC